MNPATLLLALLLCLQQPAEASAQATGVNALEPPEEGAQTVNGILAIVNDQVLTAHQVESLAYGKAQARQREGQVVTQSDFMNLRQESFQDLLLNLLFQEGFRMARLDESLLDRLVGEQIQQAIEEAGSIAAFTSRLAKEGRTIEDESRSIRRLYTSIMFMRVELGLMPAERGKGLKAHLFVSPEEIARYYEEHPEEYSQEFRVGARQILLQEKEGMEPAKDRIEALAEQIRSGSVSFADAARAHSDARASVGGYLGRINPEQSALQEPIKNFLRTAEAGQMSEPIQIVGGWVLVLAEEVREPGVTPFEEVQIPIAAKLLQTHQAELQREVVNQLRRRCYLWGPGVDVALDQAFGPPAEEEAF